MAQDRGRVERLPHSQISRPLPANRRQSTLYLQLLAIDLTLSYRSHILFQGGVELISPHTPSPTPSSRQPARKGVMEIALVRCLKLDPIQLPHRPGSSRFGQLRHYPQGHPEHAIPTTAPSCELLLPPPKSASRSLPRAPSPLFPAPLTATSQLFRPVTSALSFPVPLALASQSHGMGSLEQFQPPKKRHLVAL